MKVGWGFEGFVVYLWDLEECIPYNIFIMDEGIEKQMAATNRRCMIRLIQKKYSMSASSIKSILIPTTNVLQK